MRWFAPRTPGLPFADRADAGERLAARFRDLAAEWEAGGPDALARAVVLGIPRGGVPVAAAVASSLGLALDVVVAHKLGAPFQPELAIGAAAADGTVLVEPWAREVVGDDEAYVRQTADAEVARARSHEALLRRGRPAVDLRGRPAIIVDDGIATGATMHVAVLAARAAGASRVVVAAPVGARDSVATLRGIADDVVVVATPDPFYAVGEFYVRFDQVGDDEVAALLEAAAGRPPAPIAGEPAAESPEESPEGSSP